MKIYKKFFSVLILFAVVVSFCACSNVNNKEKEEIKYSNLTDEKNTELLSGLIIDSGVNESDGDKIIESVKYYNDTIGSDLLKREGIIDLSSPIPQYDDIKIDELWSKRNDMFIGYNCRITAFELMKNFITVSDVSKSNPTALFMDRDALNNSNDNYFTADDLAKFEALYSTINTTSSKDVDEQYEMQKEYWDSIGVEFSENDKISLISVYIHNHFSDEENELIVGHTGVLFHTEEGYIFFEKLSFQLPYQMIWFHTKEELKQYLMAAYDTDTTGESAQPFILENGHLLMAE